jgi:hypothetical protein
MDNRGVTYNLDTKFRKFLISVFNCTYGEDVTLLACFYVL